MSDYIIHCNKIPLNAFGRLIGMLTVIKNIQFQTAMFFVHMNLRLLNNWEEIIIKNMDQCKYLIV